MVLNEQRHYFPCLHDAWFIRMCGWNMSLLLNEVPHFTSEGTNIFVEEELV